MSVVNQEVLSADKKKQEIIPTKSHLSFYYEEDNMKQTDNPEIEVLGAVIREAIQDYIVLERKVENCSISGEETHLLESAKSFLFKGYLQSWFSMFGLSMDIDYLLRHGRKLY